MAGASGVKETVTLAAAKGRVLSVGPASAKALELHFFGRG